MKRRDFLSVALLAPLAKLLRNAPPTTVEIICTGIDAYGNQRTERILSKVPIKGRHYDYLVYDDMWTVGAGDVSNARMTPERVSQVMKAMEVMS